MDNQHRKIKGCRELSQEEIELMNEIKQKGNEVAHLVTKLELMHQDTREVVKPDTRWTAIGKTDLQRGFMALTRAVAKPEFF